MSSSRRDLLLLTAGCAVLFGLKLGARDLWNPNEPIYGEAVVEMAQRADWLVPHVNGLVFAEKPVLYFWLALLASKLMGAISEASLRVPALLAGLVTMVRAGGGPIDLPTSAEPRVEAGKCLSTPGLVGSEGTHLPYFRIGKGETIHTRDLLVAILASKSLSSRPARTSRCAARSGRP